MDKDTAVCKVSKLRRFKWAAIFHLQQHIDLHISLHQALVFTSFITIILFVVFYEVCRNIFHIIIAMWLFSFCHARLLVLLDTLYFYLTDGGVPSHSLEARDFEKKEILTL